jgi:hypothetical protein
MVEKEGPTRKRISPEAVFLELVLLESQIHTVKYWVRRLRLLSCWAHNILAAVRTRPANPEPLHFVDQRSPPHAKFNRCTFWAAHYPTDFVERL